MRKIVLFCTFMVYALFMNAQTGDWCATLENNTPDPTGVYSKSIDPAMLDNTCAVVFNVFFWGINQTNEPPSNLLTEEQCLTSVAQLNIVYNEFNIFFKYYGMDNSSFISETYHHVTKLEIHPLFSYAELNGFKKPDAFNIYIASGGADFAGAAKNLNQTGVISTSYFHVKEGVMVHEIGHCFNLRHPFWTWANPVLCEHVEREPTHPNFNADVAGDRVVDTPAQPDFLFEKCAELGYPWPYTDCDPINYYAYVNADFEYTGFGDDCVMPVPEAYLIEPNDVKNYMTYSPASPTMYFKNFTAGQKIRMREAIVDDEYGEFEAATTTLASLYEPYSGGYPQAPFGYPSPQYRPLFQPGFDYSFVECDCDCSLHGPTPYEDVSFTYGNPVLHISKFETDYSSITHPNHSAIYIEFDSCDEDGQNTRKCYDNYYSPPIIGGSITTFNDGVFNANVTITPQDSISINNPQLIDNLQPGLYNIIENYQNGTNQETVILKEGN